jgi:hypothetical protein
MREFIGKIAGERLWGERPGAPRALAAAVVAGSVTAVLTYRLLRG